MTIDIENVRYQQSCPQVPREYHESYPWGTFVRYIELGDDGFAKRQVDAYENGFLTRYDRVHWEDQFGALADFRLGGLWMKHWGKPILVTPEEFDHKWRQAETSPPHRLRNPSPVQPPPWIELFESGRWSGQP